MRLVARLLRTDSRFVKRLREARSLLLPLLAAGMAFVAGLHLFFPEEPLRLRLQAEVARRCPAGCSFTLQRARLQFPLRLRLDGVLCQSDLPGVPPLAFDRLVLAPAFSTFFGRPGVTLSGQGPSGRVDGRAGLDGRVDLDLRDGRFVLGGTPQQPLSLAGTISRATLQGRLPSGPQSTLAAELRLDDLVLRGGESFGLAEAPVPLGRLLLQVAGAGGSLQVQQLDLSGGALQVAGRGELLLQPALAASRVELALQLQPDEGASPALRSLLELLGPAGADGTWRLRVHGPWSAPALD